MLLLALYSKDSRAEADALARRFGPLIAYNIVERDSLSEKGLNTSVSYCSPSSSVMELHFLLKGLPSSLSGRCIF